MHELAEQRHAEHKLNRAEKRNKQYAERLPVFYPVRIHAEQHGRCEHIDDVRQAVGRLHIAARLEHKHHDDAPDEAGLVYELNIGLTLGVEGVLYLHVRHEVEVDGLAYEVIRAGDYRRGRDDCRDERHDNGDWSEHRREHLEEGVHPLKVQISGVGGAFDKPRALTEIVQQQTELYKRPAYKHVRPPHMTHIGIQRLRAGIGEKHRTEDGKSGGVIRPEDEPYRPHGVERAQNVRHTADAVQPLHGEEQKPDYHYRPHQVFKLPAACALEEEDGGNNDRGDDHNGEMPLSEQTVEHWDAAHALNRCRHRDRRHQHAVGEERRAANHRRYDQIFPALLDESVDGENAALAVVVRTHGDHDVLHGREQGYCPEYHGQYAENKFAAHAGHAAAALQHRLHDVQGGSAYIAVDKPYRDNAHCGACLFTVSVSVHPDLLCFFEEYM